MKEFFKRKIADPLLALLKQGVAPERLALCVAVGIAIGLVPVLGVSTLLATLVALTFKLNLPAIQLAQVSMSAFQLLLIVPFVRLGEWMTQAAAQPVSISAGLALMKQGIWHAVVVLKDAIIHASIAWIVVAPIGIFILYRILKPVFARAATSLPGAKAASPHEQAS
jgi:uncharacterized protein (DUF2062 family)